MPNLQKILIEITGTAEELVKTYEKVSAILLTDGTNLDVQINGILDGAVQDADSTLAAIAEWRKQHPPQSRAEDDPDPNPSDPPA